jgi:hypothetical protein
METHRESLLRILQIQTLTEIVQNEIPKGKDNSATKGIETREKKGNNLRQEMHT